VRSSDTINSEYFFERQNPSRMNPFSLISVDLRWEPIKCCIRCAGTRSPLRIYSFNFIPIGLFFSIASRSISPVDTCMNP